MTATTPAARLYRVTSTDGYISDPRPLAHAKNMIASYTLDSLYPGDWGYDADANAQGRAALARTVKVGATYSDPNGETTYKIVRA